MTKREKELMIYSNRKWFWFWRSCRRKMIISRSWSWIHKSIRWYASLSSRHFIIVIAVINADNGRMSIIANVSVLSVLRSQHSFYECESLLSGFSINAKAVILLQWLKSVIWFWTATIYWWWQKPKINNNIIDGNPFKLNQVFFRTIY